LIYAQAIALAFHGVEAQTFAAKTFPRAKQTQTMSNSPHRSFEKSTRDDLARLAQIYASVRKLPLGRSVNAPSSLVPSYCSVERGDTTAEQKNA
jgi:hypothetical protein